MDGIIDGSIPGSYTLVQCRTVRIGSYKVVPKDRVLLSSVGIRIAVPAIEDGEYLTSDVHLNPSVLSEGCHHFNFAIQVGLLLYIYINNSGIMVMNNM
jgi:sentrin-specific protease 7